MDIVEKEEKDVEEIKKASTKKAEKKEVKAETSPFPSIRLKKRYDKEGLTFSASGEMRRNRAGKEVLVATNKTFSTSTLKRTPLTLCRRYNLYGLFELTKEEIEHIKGLNAREIAVWERNRLKL